MEKAHISHQDLWNESIMRSIDLLAQLQDYAAKAHEDKLGEQDKQSDYLESFDVTSMPYHEAEAAFDSAEMLLHHLHAQLPDMEPDEVRNTLIDHLRDNLQAYLFEGESRGRYQFINDLVEEMGIHYRSLCEERAVPAAQFLCERVVGAVARYRVIADKTAEAFSQQILANQQSNGDDPKETVETPYEFALLEWQRKNTTAANDRDPSTEEEIAIQQRARRLLDIYVEAFDAPALEGCCPEMLWMLETLTAKRLKHNAPYAHPQSEEALADAVSRDFRTLLKRCPDMADDAQQLMEACGRVESLTKVSRQ